MNWLKNFVTNIQDGMAKPLYTKPLAVFSILAFIFIILRLYFPVEPLFVCVLLLGLILILLNFSGRIDSFITVFLVLAMLLGIGVADAKLVEIKRLTDKLDGQEARIFGTVASVPEYGNNLTTFMLDCDRVLSAKGEFNKVKIWVKSDESYNYKYGDRLVFNAYLESAEAVNIKLSKHFLSKGMPFVADDITLIDKSSASGFHRLLAVVRNYIIDVGDRLLPGDARALFKALTAGDTTGFSDNLVVSLSKSGLSHVASVSGLHVSILGMAVLNIFKKRNKILTAILAISFIFAFAFVTGASPAALRSAMMFTSFIVAKVSLRDNDGFTALCFSAMVLAIINPYVIYDWGFILSFLSVAGMQIFSLYFKNFLKFLPEVLAESISVTMAAQLMTIPAIANMFGYVSTYSVLANIVVSAIFLWVLYLCFALIIVSFVPVVNQLVSMVCILGLDAIINVAGLFSDMPLSIIFMDSFDMVELFVYYLLVLIFVFRKKLSASFINTVIALCAILLLIFSFIPIDATEKYTVADESYIIATEEKRVLCAKDTLFEIDTELDGANAYAIFSDVVIEGDVTGQENAVIDMRKVIKTIHIAEEYKNSAFVNMAQRMNCDIKYYPSETDVDEYVKQILK